MRMTSDIPNVAACCEAVLDGFVQCAQLMIEHGIVPAFPHLVRRNDGSPGVRYQLEPEGEEDWKLPHCAIRDGWIDCEDAALWCAAGLRAEGDEADDMREVMRERWTDADVRWDPDASVAIVRTARRKLHAVVRFGDGELWDPCPEIMDEATLRRFTDYGDNGG
jgi:hypothetical protein